jgi:hypothetical protein
LFGNHRSPQIVRFLGLLDGIREEAAIRSEQPTMGLYRENLMNFPD